MSPTLDEHLWHRLTEEITTGMHDWRAQHPKATLREIEDERDRRLSPMRARMVEDLALRSATTSWEANSDPPTGPDCGVPLHSHGTRSRTLQTYGGHDLTLERTVGTCPQCGQSFFPPR